MQQLLAALPGEQAMRLRVGLNAGETISTEDDYFGAPVVVAARLCDHAGAGQILASEVVRSLVGGRGGYRFLPLGAIRLKGLSEPVTAFELHWRGGDTATSASSPGASR
jgi:class 3 adenylate cyclase